MNEDLLQPIIYGAFITLGIGESKAQKIAGQTTLEALSEAKDAVATILKQGYPSVLDLETLAAVLKVHADEDLLRPMVYAIFARQGMPVARSTRIASKVSVVIMNEAAGILTSILQRGFPTVNDLEDFATALGMNVDEDMLQPIVHAAFVKVAMS